ncbi:MAG: FtsW/RodA/SpoVE family cell cycle protein [Bacilli bacterium]|nr:FtsW/RodA/SpoVE family cell cycle protein [Bacilli bacterium]
MNLNKIKNNKSIIFLVLLMFFISIFSIKSASILLNYEENIMIKQVIWYIIGFIFTYTITIIGNKKIYKKVWILYTIGVILLAGLLVFAEPINNSRCWFNIGGVITIQPSEFMKIILIITLGTMIDKFNIKYKNHTLKDEFLFLLKIGIIVIIPSILTFLEPDTGVVLIYLVIMITMLLVSGIRYRWFIIFFGIIIIGLTTICIIYKTNNDFFINIFGPSFFLRMDRLFDWSNKNGYQLNNGLAAIGAGGILGFGFNHTPIYFPEADTDFIFAVFASNKGFLGGLLLIIITTIFDLKLIKIAKMSKNKLDSYILAGIIGMLLYGQFQNIGMTLGIMPITGITLPFISYGGSSLISYMIILGIIININNNSLKIKK